MFSNTVLGGAQVIPESNEWYATAVNVAIQEEFYAIAEQAWKERDPREACCENLVAMAAMDGVFPRPPLHAQGYVRLTGAPGAELPAPLEFNIGDRSFVSVSSGTQPTAIGDNGSVVIRVRAIVPGSAGNIQEATGALVTRVPGVDSSVEVCGGTFCEGADAEPCEAFRARYLRRLQYQPRATNQWILDKLLEWPCATRAIQRAGSCCRCDDCAGMASECENCSCTDCGGQIAFYVMFDHSFPCGIAPASVIAEIEAWMFGAPQGYGLGQVEVGICGRIVPVTGSQVDIKIDIAACPSALQLQQIRETIAEYFTTVEPSQPLRSRVVNSLLANILGAETNFEASFVLANPEDGYGGIHGPLVPGQSKVFISNCDLEPECDIVMCLRNIDINRPDTGGAPCA